MIQKLKRQLRNIFAAGKKRLSAVSVWGIKLFIFTKGIKWDKGIKVVRGIKLKNIFQTFRSRRFGAIAVLVIFLVANVFQNTLTTQGAQYTFLQTDWSGGETANMAAHPTNSSGWDEFASATNVTTTTPGQATLPETTHENFSETFTADTFKDAVNTTANWNTTAGQVEMSGETSGVNLYEKLNGILGGSTINTQVKDGDDYYVGSSTGKFLKYSSATDTATDLTAKISGVPISWSSNQIFSLALDAANHIVYLGGGSGKFARYQTSSWSGSGTCAATGSAYAADAACDLTNKIYNAPVSWSANVVYDFYFDSVNNVLYLAGGSGKFARYQTSSWSGSGTCAATGSAYSADAACDLTAKISSFWGIETIYEISLDSANSEMYLSGNYNFAKYDIVSETASDLKGKITSIIPSSQSITASAFAGGKVYCGTSGGKFFVYDIASGNSTDLASKISSFWSGSGTQSMVYDAEDNIVYLVSNNGKFARYNTPSYIGGGTYPTADTAYDLTSKISSLWSTYSVNKLELDGANNVLYLVGDLGKFARYNTTSYAGGGTYPTADTAYNLASKISSFWSTYTVNSLKLDVANNVLYLGGATGKFARYNIESYVGGGTYPTADTAYDLTSKISSFWSTYYVYGLELDSANNVLYLGGGGGKFARYNTTSYAGGGTYPTADTGYDLTSKISSFWNSSNSFQGMAFDSINNILYFVGTNGNFARYNTTSYAGGGTYPTADTAYDLDSKISSFWSSSYHINSVAYDSSSDILYLGGNGGKFAKYSGATDSATNLVASINDANILPFNSFIYGTEFNPSEKAVYLAMYGGKFIRYNAASYVGGGTYPDASTAYDLSSKISSFWAANDINEITFDSTGSVVYLVGLSGKFARYNTTSYAGGGTYPTADTGYDLTSKISSFWSSGSISFLTFDSVSGVVYLGGQSGKFARYNTASYSGGGTYPAADTAYSLGSKVNGIDWNSLIINAVVAGDGNEIYVGGQSGRFAKYNTQTGVTTDLSARISSFWAGGTIQSMIFDSASNVIYIGKTSSRGFARYNTTSYAGGGTYPTADTAYDLSAKISSFWPAGIYNQSLVFDSANKVIYLGGSSGYFARYNTTSYTAGGTYPTADTGYNLTSKISSFWSTNPIYSIDLDNASNVLYLGGVSGKFALYNTTFNDGLDATYPTADTAHDLTSKISSFWAASGVNSLVFDDANGVAYLGGQSGKFARYNPASYGAGGTYPDADTAYNFTTKLTSTSWTTQSVSSIISDSSNNALYLGGTAGRFARYSIAADSVTYLRSPDTLSWWGTVVINTLALDASGKLYIGGASGYFAEKPAAASVSHAVSSTLDAQSYNIAYATLTKSDTVGTGTISYQLSNDGGATWEDVTPAVNHVFTSVGSDLRFKIAVSGNATVQSVAIEYWAYAPSGELISSKYNATDATNVLAKMAWTESLPSGTDVKFQIRTAASAVGLDTAAWCGPDNGTPGSCNSATYFTNPAGTETIDDLNNDLTNDQWFQYKTVLTTSDGVNTPTLSDATVTYVVNAPPELQSVTASQGSDGLVTVNYQVRDPDTTTGVTQGLVNVGLQYCTANCGTPGSETWANATALTGNYGAGLAVQEVNWTSYQLVWNPNTDYAGNYNATNFKIRVKAYDGELANHTGYGSSATFTLDTSDPTLAANTLLINNSATAVTPETSALTLKLQNVTGDTATETVYAQFSSDGSTWYGANSNSTLAAAGSWGTGFALNNIAALSWPWTMAARSETITVRIKDGYGNLQATADTNSSQYNAYPELQTITASQGADGLVTVGFEVKDTDTATGANPNQINITLQYCTANCSAPGGETWTDALTATGDGAGVSVAGATWTAHQIVWTAKTDYDEQYNATNFKVRVKANDGETVNNLDYLESSIFTLDTKDPTNVSVVINHTTNTLTLATPNDNSSYQMGVSNVAGTFSAFETFASPYTYGSMTSDPATVYVRIKDAYGNYTDASATTPARPSNPIFFDISSASQGTYQEFVAWDVVSASQVGSGFSSYKVYRKINSGAYSLLSTISDRNINYVLDRIKDTNPDTTDSDPTFDPNNPSTYYYKVVTTDTNGNISAFSGETSDIPNGTGGSDTTPPTISDVQVTNVNTTSAKVSWTTDELSNSSVGYSPDTTYLPERGLSSMTLSHEIVLTGLSPGSTYNIRVKSYDAMGNLAQNDKDAPGSSPIPNFTFSTHPGPAISQVTIPHIYNNQATITWKTTTNSNTYVVYSDTVTDGALVAPEEVGTPTMVGGSAPYSHTQTISSYQEAELSANTTYYFYVKSVDGSSNVATDDNGGDFYQLLTTEDTTAPVISGVNAAIINNVEAAINWTTDEPSTSVVNYGTESGNYTETGEVLTYNSSHYVILSGLTPNTTYYFTVTSADINTNSDTSIEYSFTSLMDPAQQHDPLAGMTATVDSVEYDLTQAASAAVFEPAVLTDTSAVIEFTTDQIAMCVIEYRADGQAYNPTDFSIEETGYNVNHSMHIMSLVLDSLYYYRIECVDNLPVGQAGLVNSTEFSFTTLEQQYGTSEIGSLSDSVAPTISGISAEVISGESVTVTWTTDEAASSYVNYGIVSGTYTDMAGDPLINNDKTLYDTAHTVTVNGLVPGIEYYFTVISHDVAGNIAESSQSSFTTENSSSLSSINITSSALGEALVTWSTSEKISSIVEYGLTNVYGQKKEDSTATTDHSVTINGLAAAQTYHLRVKGEDANGQLFSSGDYTFIPKSPPQIGTVVIKDITEHEATVAFTTDFPTDYTITYTSVGGDTDSGSKGKPDFAINHEITLDKLKPGTTYALKIKASDEQGNSVEKVAQNFTTGKDEKAPEITKARTESALAQSDKVQTIISWETNELSECSLIYREGAGGEDKEYKVSDRAAVNHVAVVTTFKPGTVYYFKIKSVDEAGNPSVSSEYALLTPQKKENIVQIIVNNFQDIFSWVNKV